MTPQSAFDATRAFVLPLAFELDRPAILAAATGSASLQGTLPYVPGSSLLGALAWRWIDRNPNVRDAGASDEFRRLFLGQEVRFLSAYPEHPALTGERLLPVPRSIRAVKGQPGRFRDLASSEPDDDQQLEAAGNAATFCAVGPNQLTTFQTELRIAYHVARPKNRARGRATEHEGEFFTYESIAAGQRFVGAALGPEDLLDRLRDLLSNDSGPVWIGRSATAEYGGGLRFDLERLQPHAFVSERLPQPDEPPDVPFEVARLVVTLTSPLLAADRCGEPTLRFPTEEFAGHLRRAGWLVPGAVLHLQASFQGSETVGGFSGRWRLPKPLVNKRS